MQLGKQHSSLQANLVVNIVKAFPESVRALKKTAKSVDASVRYFIIPILERSRVRLLKHIDNHRCSDFVNVRLLDYNPSVNQKEYINMDIATRLGICKLR